LMGRSRGVLNKTTGNRKFRQGRSLAPPPHPPRPPSHPAPPPPLTVHTRRTGGGPIISRTRVDLVVLNPGLVSLFVFRVVRRLPPPSHPSETKTNGGMSEGSTIEAAPPPTTRFAGEGNRNRYKNKNLQVQERDRLKPQWRGNKQS
jgi:hypothetical protein